MKAQEAQTLGPDDPIWRHMDYWPPEGRPRVPPFLLRAELERAFADSKLEAPWLSEKLRPLLLRAVKDKPKDAAERAAYVLEDPELTELLEAAFLDWTRNKMAAQAPGPMIFIVARQLREHLETCARMRAELKQQLARYSNAEQALLAELERRTGRPLTVLLNRSVGALLAEACELKEGEEGTVGAFQFARRDAHVYACQQGFAGQKVPESWPFRALVYLLRQVYTSETRARLDRLEKTMALLDFRLKVAALLGWHLELFGTAPGTPPASNRSQLEDPQKRMWFINGLVLKAMDSNKDRLPRGFWKDIYEVLWRYWQQAGLSLDRFPYKSARSLQNTYNRWASKPQRRPSS